MASSIETTSTTTTLKNNGNTYATVDTNDDVTITNDLAVTGNVGIGTTATTKLHIRGGTDAIARVDAQNDAAANPELQLTAVARQFNVGVGGATFGTAALRGSYYLYDNTATAYRFVIDNTGNVGIGTTAPAVDLNVSKSADGVAARFQRTSGGGLVDIETYNGIGGIGTGDNIPFRLNTNNAERVRILTDGKVGIGTNAPTDTLQVAGGVTATSFNGGQLAGFRNRIINGMFDIAQRGTSFTNETGNGQYSMDRWRTEGYGLTGGTDIVRNTFGAGENIDGNYASYYARVTTKNTIPSGQYWAFQQRVETPQVIRAGETLTLSFWARAPSGTIPAGRFNCGIGATGTSSPALTTTWQKITSTTTNCPSYGAGVSVYVVFVGGGQPALSVDIANVQVESGTVATPFERRSYGTELALCQRYYYKTTDAGSAFGTAVLGNLTAESSECSFMLPTTMRAEGTVVIHDAAGTVNKVSYYSGGWQNGGTVNEADMTGEGILHVNAANASWRANVSLNAEL